MLFVRTLDDPFDTDVADLRRGRYGVIEIRDGELWAIHLRPVPKFVSGLEASWFGWHARHTAGDRCWLYYDQPWRYPRFLALKFVAARRDASFATCRRAATVLDAVARVKQIDAIVCDVWNPRISERLLARWGWQPLQAQRWHRNYIKRFYGSYPQPPLSCDSTEASHALTSR